MTYYISTTYYITCVFPRASGAAGPQSSYHRSLHYPPHLENHSVFARVSPGVEGGRRSDVHNTLAQTFKYCVTMKFNATIFGGLL